MTSMLAMAILYGYWVHRTNHYVFTMAFLWHHVKEEVQIELELQMKKAEMIIRRIGHIPVAHVLIII